MPDDVASDDGACVKDGRGDDGPIAPDLVDDGSNILATACACRGGPITPAVFRVSGSREACPTTATPGAPPDLPAGEPSDAAVRIFGRASTIGVDGAPHTDPGPGPGRRRDGATWVPFVPLVVRMLLGAITFGDATTEADIGWEGVGLGVTPQGFPLPLLPLIGRTPCAGEAVSGGGGDTFGPAAEEKGDTTLDRVVTAGITAPGLDSLAHSTTDVPSPPPGGVEDDASPPSAPSPTRCPSPLFELFVPTEPPDVGPRLPIVAPVVWTPLLLPTTTHGSSLSSTLLPPLSLRMEGEEDREIGGLRKLSPFDPCCGWSLLPCFLPGRRCWPSLDFDDGPFPAVAATTAAPAATATKLASDNAVTVDRFLAGILCVVAAALTAIAVALIRAAAAELGVVMVL